MGTPSMSEDDPISRLARHIEAAHEAERLVRSDEIADLRRQAALGLHTTCAEFVLSVNTRLAKPRLDLSPATYAPDLFRETGINVFQVSSEGRQMQITFAAPRQPVATEKFAIPYILEGEIRTYSQKMLERFEISTRMIFFCVASDRADWRYFDWRTRSTGAIDRGFLISLMEPLF